MVGALAPARQQAIQRNRIDDGARENMRAGLRALLDDDDREALVELLEANGGAKPRRSGADDDDVVIHRIARRQFFLLRRHAFMFRSMLLPFAAA